LLTQVDHRQTQVDKQTQVGAVLHRVATCLEQADAALSQLDMLGVEHILLPIHRASIPTMRARIQRLILANQNQTAPPAR
jgi:hypothetical protein